MKNLIEEKRQEEYLFKIVRKVIEWARTTDFEKKELADLIMPELLNIKK